MTEGPGRTVLLVEDNETIRDAFAILLGESGYNVISAGTGREALDLAKSDRPDLILMDLGLPDMNGLEVTRRIKGGAKTKDIVVVALTGRALETDQAECLAAGCAGYLPKPIDTRRLLNALPRYLAGENDLTSS